MGKNQIKIVIAEIEKEQEFIKELIQESDEYYEHNKEEIDATSHLRVLSSILHDFYTGIEKVFKKISISIDENLPSDIEWHSNLLNQMSLEIPGIRKQVINDNLKEKLYDYLRFRHIFRNVYGSKLNWEKMEHLIKGIDDVLRLFNSQINDFIKFLESFEKE